MSYDLYLFSPKLNRDSYARYFGARAHYDSSGRYANEETGVYFGFEYVQPAMSAEDEARSFGADHVIFNMNYFRPHTFGLEAEPELSAFAAAFDCTVEDDQLDGMGSGPYTASGFLRCWNKGNAIAFDAIDGKGDGSVLYADGMLIEQVWRWNLQRKTSQANFGESHFLPRVMWARRMSDGATTNLAVWGEGVPTAFPACAANALLMRERPPKSLPFFPKKEQEKQAKLMPMDEVALLDGCAWREIDGSDLLLAPLVIPPSNDVVGAFNGTFGKLEAILQIFAPDHVLDRSFAPSRA